MSVQSGAAQRAPETSLINDPRFRAALYQVLVLAAIVAFVIFIGVNTAANLVRQSKTTGFDFFWRTSGFDISFSLISYSRASSYAEAFLVGVLNTVLVSALGILFATILGFLVGIARLSQNWLISRIATVYVETLRNIPLLLQLFFWYFAVLKAMPAVRDSIYLGFDTYINQRGLFVPRPIFDDQFVWVPVAIVAGLIASWFIARWAKLRLERTGQRFPTFLASIGTILALVVLVWTVSGASVVFEIPVLNRFNFAGGLAVPPELVALWLGLTLYTATYIAETVRGGILAVNRGQTEAAYSLGLRDGDRLRLVIIPQAMRVIIPPLTSQYLNLTKNSSLAAAIGYPDFVSVFMGTTLNQTGRALEVVSITMLVYLTLSLSTSALMNWYNSRAALVER